MMRMTNMDGWVAFVGAGPGDDGLMTLRGARLLGAANLVIADAELAERFRHLFTAETTVAEPSDAAGSVKALLQGAKVGQFAVRLCPGDPLLSGGAAEVQPCAKPQERDEIVPGVPTSTGILPRASTALPAESSGEL